MTTADRIALLCGNTDAFVAVRDAVTVDGDVLVPINPRLAAPEVAYILDRANPVRVYADPALAHLLPPGVAWIDAATATPARAPRPGEIGATLLFTSGTTGRPKGCLRGAEQEEARAAELIATYSISADDVHLIACPLAHSAPGIFLRAGRSVGARTVILPRFRAESFLEAVERERATLFFLVPTQYQRILALPPETRRRYDVSSVRAAIVAGAPIGVDAKRQVIEWLGGDKLWEFYGSSETGTVSVLRPDEQLSRPGSVGRPPPGVELKLIDSKRATEPAARGERRSEAASAGPILRAASPDASIGETESRDPAERRFDHTPSEIYVRSPAVMTGYLDGSTEWRDGFLSVGDLGRLDDDGYLYLVDRKHDTIISGGMNVYPAEVERALAEHAGVTGAVVFGLPHPDWGQVVTAMVAGRAGEDALRGFLRERIAGYKVPKRFVFVTADELPVGASGKPLRRRARELVAARDAG